MKRLGWVAALALTALAVFPAGAQISLSGPRLHYVLHCRGCHLQDGRETPGSVPALAGLGLFLQVPEGRDYLIRVPGVANAPLDDAELAALLNWMVAEFGGQQTPPNWVRYTAEEVASQRYRPLLEVEKTRTALLRAAGLDDSGGQAQSKGPVLRSPPSPP